MFGELAELCRLCWRSVLGYATLNLLKHAFKTTFTSAIVRVQESHFEHFASKMKFLSVKKRLIIIENHFKQQLLINHIVFEYTFPCACIRMIFYKSAL